MKIPKRVIKIRKSKERQHNGKKEKDKHQSTKRTHKTKDRVRRTPLTTGGELRCFERVTDDRLLHFFVQRQYIYRHYGKLFGLLEICAIEIRLTKKQKSLQILMGYSRYTINNKNKQKTKTNK